MWLMAKEPKTLRKMGGTCQTAVIDGIVVAVVRVVIVWLLLILLYLVESS